MPPSTIRSSTTATSAQVPAVVTGSFRSLRSGWIWPATGSRDFSFISPDECFDMHSCPLARGDAWLATWVPRILGALGPKGLLIVVFDEGSSHAGCCDPAITGGHVAAVIAGPGARRRTQITTPLDHYSVLRLIEDAWGLRRLRHAADGSTPSISGWRAP
jgi:hypothetical protein